MRRTCQGLLDYFFCIRVTVHAHVLDQKKKNSIPKEREKEKWSPVGVSLAIEKGHPTRLFFSFSFQVCSQTYIFIYVYTNIHAIELSNYAITLNVHFGLPFPILSLRRVSFFPCACTHHALQLQTSVISSFSFSWIILTCKKTNNECTWWCKKRTTCNSMYNYEKTLVTWFFFNRQRNYHILFCVEKKKITWHD